MWLRGFFLNRNPIGNENVTHVVCFLSQFLQSLCLSALAFDSIKWNAGEPNLLSSAKTPASSAKVCAFLFYPFFCFGEPKIYQYPEPADLFSMYEMCVNVSVVHFFCCRTFPLSEYLFRCVFLPFRTGGMRVAKLWWTIWPTNEKKSLSFELAFVESFQCCFLVFLFCVRLRWPENTVFDRHQIA